MKALIYKGKGNLVLEEAPDPVPKEGEISIRVGATGICGSDMHAYHGRDERRPPPLILGHETSGTAIEGRYAGKTVTVNPLVTCGQCGFCENGKDNLCPNRQIISMPPREGAFAEWVSIPERNLVEVENGVSPEDACLVEPLATGYHAVACLQKVYGRPLPEARIAVIGGGAIGVGCAEILRCFGVPASSLTVVEKNPLRLETCRKFLNCDCCLPEEAKGRSRGADLVIDAVGNEHTHSLSSDLCNPGAFIIRIGLEQSNQGYDIRKHTLSEITLLGSYTYTRKDFRRTADLVFSGALGKLPWKTVLPCTDGPKAFKDIESGRMPFAKVVLRFPA